jgi:hypothetical protein
MEHWLLAGLYFVVAYIIGFVVAYIIDSRWHGITKDDNPQ